jgi:hypothetical protein
VIFYALTVESGSNAVGMAACHGLDHPGVGMRAPVGSRIFTSPYHPHRLWGTPSLLWNAYRGLLPHSLPTSADVKKTWIYTSTPPYAFMA